MNGAGSADFLITPAAPKRAAPDFSLFAKSPDMTAHSLIPVT
jgi:hypothetical protein